MKAHRPSPLCAATAMLLFAAQPAATQAPVAQSAASENAGAGDVRSILVVTGSATPVAIEEIGSTLTVLNGDRIEQQGFAFLQDALRSVPGVAVNQGGSFGSVAQVRIRGAEGNHTLVLIDGVEVNAIGQGEFDFSTLLASNIDRVEVLRGAQSGLYGSNALGGVINVITRGGDGPLFDAALEAGSFGTVMGRGSVTVGDTDTFLSASGIVRSTDGFSSAAIGTEDDGNRNITGYLRGGIQLAPFARLDATLRFVDSETETDGFDFTGGPLQGLAIDSDDFADTREWSGGLALTMTMSDAVKTVFTGAYTDGRTTGGAGNTGSFGNEGQRVRASGRTTLGFDTGAGANHALTAFLDYENERFRNTFPSEPSQIPEQSRDILGVGLEYRLTLFENLFLNAALRHDQNSAFSDATTYNLNGSWVIAGTGTRLHANYGKGVTNPTFTEQFGFFPGQFVGNPDLTPEQAKGFDVGIEQRIGDAVVLDLTWFQSTLTDELIDVFPSVENDTGESEREGVEFSARANLGRINLGGSYTWLNARDPDGTREVRRPEHQASLDAGLTFGPAERGNLTLGLIYNGEMLDTDFRNFFVTFAAEKSPLEDYVLARIAGSYQLTETLQLFGRVENLLDEDYAQAISYASPGLSAYGGLRVSLR